MPTPWNDGTERQLLLTIIHLTAPQMPNWGQVATMMGEGFTAESTGQHFQKMRKDCKAKFGDPGEASKGTSAKSTPRKANGEMASKSTGKRKGKKAAKADDEDADDDENESPSKKVKVKAETKDEDDSP